MPTPTPPAGGYLLSPPPPGPGVCATCLGHLIGPFSCCATCHEQRQVLEHVARRVVPVSLSPHGGDLHRDLAGYKDPGCPDRAERQARLAALLGRWLARHEPCLARAAGVPRFPVVTTVPSSTGRRAHPLELIAGRLVGATRERYRPLLAAPPGEHGREADGQRFHPLQVPRGEAVLLLEDTWASGAHAQSAACALRAAGSGPVLIVPIGRHVRAARPGGAPVPAAQAYLAAARERGWDWAACPVESAGGSRRARAVMLPDARGRPRDGQVAQSVRASA